MARIAVLALVGAAFAGCYSGGGEPTPSDAPGGVGPAPLRRLSNAEYLNALGDLFPSIHPALPALPGDVPVAGFENAVEAQRPSDVRIARYEEIANLYAAAATADATALRALVGCDDWSTPSSAIACATAFVDGTGARIFRKPLTSTERDRYVVRFQTWQSAIDFEGAVELTLSAWLQSPQFLYRPEPAPPAGAATSPVEPYAMASRLSFFLWESVPDDALLRAASRDELRTVEQVRAQAGRMLDDPRARRAYWSFHRQWLGLDRVLQDEGLARTPRVDASWSATSQRSSFDETRLFVENTLASGGTFRDLLTSRRAWIDAETARIYGVAAPDAAWGEVALPESERAGLLTRVAFLAGFAHRGATSPPVRGNAVELRLLCQLPVSPPPNADLSAPTATPDQGPQTNRMLFEARTQPAACQACHAGLNGFGFGFEHYGASGMFQATDDGLPVDATGTIHGTDVDGPFDGAIALSEKLSRSATVNLCATQQWIRYALGRAPADVELPTVRALAARFGRDGDVRALLLDVVTSPSFRLRTSEGG